MNNPQTEKLKVVTNAKPFKTFAYYIAWIGFLGGLALAIRDAIKNEQPPDKNDYYK